MIPIRTLRAEALGLAEDPFVAKYPHPALVIDAGDGPVRPSAGDPMAWLGKTVADEDPADMDGTSTSIFDPGQTASPEVVVAAAAARSLVFFVQKTRQHELFPDMVTIGRIACGSPATVADTIAHWCEEAGCSRVNVVCELGDMPEWKTVKSMTKFAGEVIPKLRAGGVSAATDGRPVAAAGVR